ncbi:MAG: hypothetical protein RL326_2130 [Pseudomonadota bacterium]|jgi:hypothetical protein
MEQAERAQQENEVRQESISEPREESGMGSAGEYLDKALNLIGRKMRGAANIMRERAPQEGATTAAFTQASNVLDATGRYMMRERVVDDVGGVVRRYPLRSLGVCFLAGLLVGNATRMARR